MLTLKHLIILSLLHFQGHAWRKINAKILNVSYEYSRDVTDMNATLSEDGALFIYLKSLVDVNQAFLTVVLSFSTDRSDKFDMNYLNKTVNFCKLLSGARYEPLIKLNYQLSSKKWHLPQRCPIKKNDLFYASNYTVVTDKFPPVLPETKMSYHLVFNLMRNGRLHKAFDLTLILEVRHIN